MGRTKGCKNKITKSESKNNIYIDKDELSEEVINCQKTGVVSDKLAKMFMLLVSRVNRINRFTHPDEYKDYEQYALLSLLLMYKSYDPTKGSAFAFFTQQAIFGIAGGYKKMHLPKYNGTVRLSYNDDNNNNKDMFNF